MPENLIFHSGLTLSKWSYCSVLLDAVKRFLLSNDEHPQQAHIPLYGCLEALDAEGLAQFPGQAICGMLCATRTPVFRLVTVALRVLGSFVRSSDEIMTRKPPTDKPLASKNSVHTL